MEVALVNGLFLRMTGSPAGGTLVLLHAFGDSGLAFTPLFATPLADRFRLVAVDLAGFGASPPRDGVRTIADHAKAVADLVASLPERGPVGLVAHSMASMIAVEGVPYLGARFAGLFSIEGNLIAEDAYLSGQAGDFDDPLIFKQHFLDHLWTMAQGQLALRRYFANVILADPTAMWELGRDARSRSVNDEPGQAYRRIRRSLYYWSQASTVDATRRWIAQFGIAQRQFTDASHWPMVDKPEDTAQAISIFFEQM
jgi:pimeloyl-ACP methyl ester carboxylesterase